MALLSPAKYSQDYFRNRTGATTLMLELGRGGVLDWGQSLGYFWYTRLQYPIGNDGTGKTASGLFRMSNF
jgi:hypothetical protein